MWRSIDLAIVFLLLIGCAKAPDLNSETDSQSPSERPWVEKGPNPSLKSGQISTQLSESQVRALQLRALSGDPESARIVFLYSAERERVASPTTLDIDSQRWLLIAAENGDSTSASILGQNLLFLGGAENCRRGAFWLERASTLNPSTKANADDALKVLADEWSECVGREAHREE